VAVEVHNTGLVAAYGFDEPSGATATDAIDGHNGTVSGAARVTGGRFGGALSFDGVDDWVSVPNDAALNLSAGMTIEAWVKPTVLSSWRSVVMKEQASALPYALYANSATDTPAAQVMTSSLRNASGPPALGVNTWTHLAMTWDGSVVRLFVDGAEVANGPAPGTLLTSTGQLRIGGNSLRGEFFAGLIDEVRVYDRALAPARIGADMNAPVSP
jgi:Concanavalin A-like lectin/glucanases superfamily